MGQLHHKMSISWWELHLPKLVQHIKIANYNIAKLQYRQLNDDLNTVSQWLIVNRLTLNATKTKTMLFGTQQHLSKREGGGGLNSTLTGNL